MKETTIQILEQKLNLTSGTSLGISSSDPLIIKEVLYRLFKQTLPCNFYITQPDMLYETMNVLEYLMFATRHLKKSSVLSKQQELLDLLTSVNLGYISLTPIYLLTKEEQMVILLCTALLSNEPYLIYDITDFEFEMHLILSMKELILRHKKPKTTLIIGTMQPKLIGICLKDTLFIHDNQICYFGSVEELYHSMDRVLYVLNHQNAESFVPRLVQVFPMYEVRTGNNLIFIMRKDGSIRNDEVFFATLAKEKLIPDQIKINHGRVENSFQELIEFNAILK